MPQKVTQIVGTDVISDANPLPIGGSLGKGDLTTDAWGVQLMSLPRSLFHGMWTFDIPASMWFMYENGVQVYTSTSIISVGGQAQLNADAAGNADVKLESRECPRYKPDRGHRVADAGFVDSATDDATYERGLGTQENGVFFRWVTSTGKLYAIIRSGNVETYTEEIDTSVLTGFDITKGFTFDIQFQWRSVGNFNFFVGDPAIGAAKLVHTIEYLGTLRRASIENPAMPYFARVIAHSGTASMTVGCADITSENGESGKEQYASTRTVSYSGPSANFPALVIHNPLQIAGQTNTRSISFARLSINSSKKTSFEVWMTRNPADIIGATFKVIGDGSFIQTDSTDNDATAVRATSANIANMRHIINVNVEANVQSKTDNPNPSRIKFKLVRGDYLVVTCEDATASVDVTAEWGEKI